MLNSISNIKNHIDKQIAFNRGKNLFEQQANSFVQFIDGTNDIVQVLPNLGSAEVCEITDYATSRTLEELYRINQYYNFDEPARVALRDIYFRLLINLKTKREPEQTAQNHYKLLSHWLLTTNPFSQKLYGNQKSRIDAVPCAEYSPQLQLSLLCINLETLNEPILDIGCGRKGALVKYLNDKGFRAYGIDRLEVDRKNCSQSDWFEYNFGNGKWGSIISHLSFTNHFRHHHLRTDGQYVAYARKYMELLEGLKSGGSFYYSPGLPFIEQYLDAHRFEVTTSPILANEFTTTKINRL